MKLPIAAASLLLLAVACKSPSSNESASSNERASDVAPMKASTEMVEVIRLGEPITVPSATPLASVMAAPASEQVVRVEGTITDVCRRKGCWLMLSDGTQSMRVSVRKCGEVAVPVSAIGRKVAVVGVAEKKTIDEATARHYAEESGKDPGAVQGDQVVVAMTANGIEIH